AANAAAALHRAAAPAKRALSYLGAAAVRVTIAAAGVKPAVVELPRSEKARPGPIPPRPGSDAKADATSANLFTRDAAPGDADDNRSPDRVDVVLSPSGEGTERTIDLAARLGLESTGISIPIALPPDRLGKPDDEPTLVLIGTAHPLIDQLKRDKK